MSRTEAEILEQALRHLHRIRDYALLDTTDDVVIDAIALRLAAAIDALARLPQATAHELFGADWPAMRGLRNRIVHGYGVIRTDVVRITVVSEVPEMTARIESRIAASSPR